MVLFYLIFFGINCVIAFYLYQRGQKVVENLKADAALVTVLDTVFLTLEVLVLLFLYYVTVQAILIEFTNKPKPFFLVTWGLGIFAYGILNFLRGPVDMYLRRRAEQQSDYSSD